METQHLLSKLNRLDSRTAEGSALRDLHELESELTASKPLVDESSKPIDHQDGSRLLYDFHNIY